MHASFSLINQLTFALLCDFFLSNGLPLASLSSYLYNLLSPYYIFNLCMNWKPESADDKFLLFWCSLCSWLLALNNWSRSQMIFGHLKAEFSWPKTILRWSEIQHASPINRFEELLFDIYVYIYLQCITKWLSTWSGCICMLIKKALEK